MKKFFCLLFILPVFLFSFLPCSATSSSSGFYVDGFYTLENSGFPNTPLYDPLSSPVVNSSFSPPSGYSLIGYVMDCGFSSPTFPYSIEYLYGDASQTWKFYSSGSNIIFSCQSSNLYYVVNSVNSEGERTFVRYRTQGGNYTSGRLLRFTVFIDTVDNNGNINRPQNQVVFTMNTAIIGYNLAFNSQINSGDATSVDYYIFPSSTPIVSGSTSTLVSSTPSTELTQAQEDSFLSRGFRLLTYGLDDLITDISSPKVSLSTSSSSRSSGVFDPDSFGVSYEKIGVGRLFPSSSGGGVSTSGSLSLKDMISLHTGVYANSSLKLVGVVTTADTSFIATFDFAPSAIVGGSPVPPSNIQGQVPYPDFDNQNSDFKELADYLKDLMQANNDNSIRNNSNFIANLMAIPWANFVGTGFSSKLPELSFALDSLFDSLFDKYTAPSEEQINMLINDVNEERAYLRQKLAFVDDVKSEVFFIQSTFISAGDTPRPFTITLPDFMMGYHESGHQEALVRYDLISENTRQAMHDVIIVFCSLCVIMHIWHTLPATVGNMPRE